MNISYGENKNSARDIKTKKNNASKHEKIMSS